MTPVCSRPACLGFVRQFRRRPRFATFRVLRQNCTASARRHGTWPETRWYHDCRSRASRRCVDLTRAALAAGLFFRPHARLPPSVASGAGRGAAMLRRDVIALIGGTVVAWRLAGRAQPRPPNRQRERASAWRRQAATSCSLLKTSICKAVSAGSRTLKQVPCPTRLSAVIVPPCSAMML
jgi:hypothetical protein